MRNLACIALSIGAASALLVGCGGPEALLGSPSGSKSVIPSTGSKTFKYTGSKQWFKVPAGVSWLTVIARGAAGGGSRGGRGGRVHAIIPVTPGERLAVLVGGQGVDANGGFNGGGPGAGGFGYGYGGGGASDIREGGDALTNRVLVAGAGGGEGGQVGSDEIPPSRYYQAAGGKGGGSTGGTGQNGWPDGYYSSSYDWGGFGGAGGTQNQGGAGGQGGISVIGYGNSGYDGALGVGGAAGAGCYGSTCWDGSPGGGGGGGYYGGGGGGAGGAQSDIAYGGGGGGGGSSYIEPSAKKFRVWSGWKTATGNGLIVLHW